MPKSKKTNKVKKLNKIKKVNQTKTKTKTKNKIVKKKNNNNNINKISEEGDITSIFNTMPLLKTILQKSLLYWYNYGKNWKNQKDEQEAKIEELENELKGNGNISENVRDFFLGPVGWIRWAIRASKERKINELKKQLEEKNKETIDEKTDDEETDEETDEEEIIKKEVKRKQKKNKTNKTNKTNNKNKNKKKNKKKKGFKGNGVENLDKLTGEGTITIKNTPGIIKKEFDSKNIINEIDDLKEVIKDSRLKVDKYNLSVRTPKDINKGYKLPKYMQDRDKYYETAKDYREAHKKEKKPKEKPHKQGKKVQKIKNIEKEVPKELKLTKHKQDTDHKSEEKPKANNKSNVELKKEELNKRKLIALTNKSKIPKLDLSKVKNDEYFDNIINSDIKIENAKDLLKTKGKAIRIKLKPKTNMLRLKKIKPEDLEKRKSNLKKIPAVKPTKEEIEEEIRINKLKNPTAEEILKYKKIKKQKKRITEEEEKENKELLNDKPPGEDKPVKIKRKRGRPKGSKNKKKITKEDSESGYEGNGIKKNKKIEKDFEYYYKKLLE